MAPEIADQTPYHGIAVDIFSLGVILFAMVTTQQPFGHFETIQGMDVLQHNNSYNLFSSNQRAFFAQFE